MKERRFHSQYRSLYKRITIVYHISIELLNAVIIHDKFVVETFVLHWNPEFVFYRDWRNVVQLKTNSISSIAHKLHGWTACNASLAVWAKLFLRLYRLLGKTGVWTRF